MFLIGLLDLLHRYKALWDHLFNFFLDGVMEYIYLKEGVLAVARLVLVSDIVLLSWLVLIIQYE